jgi:hypothetical protein
VLQHADAPAAFASLDGAEQAGGAGAKNQSVKSVDQEGNSFSRGIPIFEFPLRFPTRLN